MKNTRYFLLLMLLFITPVLGEEQPLEEHLEKNGKTSADLRTIRLRYLKIGTELGIGYREHKDLHGFDISLNQAIVFYPYWINMKGLYVQYPFYKSQHFFYWGLGAGINYEFNYHSESGIIPGLGCSLKTDKNCHHHRCFPSLEGVVGYEFFTDKDVKMFIQGGLSVPLGESSLPFVPSLSIGVGF